MSLIPTCVVCDALLRGYNGNCLCERCKQPCATCGGDVAHCQHPLSTAEAIRLIALREGDAEPTGDPLLRKNAA